MSDWQTQGGSVLKIQGHSLETYSFH